MDTLNSAKYHYKALEQEREIRVLVLLPGGSDDYPQCHLKRVCLDDPPPYEALSYVWGDPRENDQIHCGNGTLSVTINLHSALRHLRVEETERVIWVDAICINQDDIDERGKQVRLMGQIYRSARQTLVWVGEETKELERSLQSVQNLRDNFFSFATFTVDGGFKATDPAFTDGGLARLRNGSVNWEWEPLVSLLQLPWFQRKWVIQETALSENIIVLCGCSILPWHILQEFVYCGRNLLNSHIILFDKVAIIALNNVALMIGFRDVQFTLCELLFATRMFLCTDPRDHIYALLGLASDIRTGYKSLSIDYSSSVTTIMHQLCLCIVKEKGTLEFLSSAFRGNYKDMSLPSWVPDILSPNLYGMSLPFKPTRNSALNVDLSQNEKILPMMGKMIDEVKMLTQPLTPLNHFIPEDDDTIIWQGEKSENTKASEDLLGNGGRPPILHTYFENYKEWLQHCMQIACPPGEVPASATRVEQFYRTLLWDVSNHHTSIVMEPLSLEKCSLVSEFVSTITKSVPREERDEDWMEQIQFFAYEVENPLIRLFGGRRFCSTADGHLGSLPHNAQAGDVTRVLYDGDMPYILRPCGDGRYKFVGDCYLHGFMWGQAMDLNRETQEFVLI